MSTRGKAQDIINRLKKSQESEDTEISLTTENIKNITTGMDVFQIELDKLYEAPSEWNFYSPLSDQKMTELLESIMDNGLLNPIILWEQGDKYMILAGHNRVRAYTMLYEQTKDEKYRKIYAYIKKKNELTEDDAKAIIIDTNFVQRQLSTAEKTKSILIKYRQLGRKKRNSGGKTTAEVIAEQFSITDRMVYNYYKLKDLIPEFSERIDKGSLSMKAGLKLARFDQVFQKRLFEGYNDKLVNKKVMAFAANLSDEEIMEELSTEIEKPSIRVSFDIPIELEAEFRDYVSKWLSKNYAKNIEE